VPTASDPTRGRQATGGHPAGDLQAFADSPTGTPDPGRARWRRSSGCSRVCFWAARVLKNPEPVLPKYSRCGSGREGYQGPGGGRRWRACAGDGLGLAPMAYREWLTRASSHRWPVSPPIGTFWRTPCLLRRQRWVRMASRQEVASNSSPQAANALTPSARTAQALLGLGGYPTGAGACRRRSRLAGLLRKTSAAGPSNAKRVKQALLDQGVAAHASTRRRQAASGGDNPRSSSSSELGSAPERDGRRLNYVQ
jgi:hypothetical protein